MPDLALFGADGLGEIVFRNGVEFADDGVIP